MEGVLQLADHFMLDEVVGKCINFLAFDSKLPLMTKYRIADKFALEGLKVHKQIIVQKIKHHHV